MSEETKATLLELLKEVVAITENPEIPYVAFFDYSGHVEVVTVRVYRDDTDWSGTDKQKAGNVFSYYGYAESVEDAARMRGVLRDIKMLADCAPRSFPPEDKKAPRA